MIYEIFLKSENTGWTKLIHESRKWMVTGVVQEFIAEKKKAMKNGHLVIDVKVKVSK